MSPGQSLSQIAATVLVKLGPVLAETRPDWVIVQGDTATAFIAALAAFYARIPVAHVEAGLRPRDSSAPWPEERNRSPLTTIAALHFAPLPSNAANLRREGVDERSIHVTGNTGIDALRWLLARLRADGALAARAEAALAAAGLAGLDRAAAARLVLITCH